MDLLGVRLCRLLRQERDEVGMRENLTRTWLRRVLDESTGRRYLQQVTNLRTRCTVPSR